MMKTLILILFLIIMMAGVLVWQGKANWKHAIEEKNGVIRDLLTHDVSYVNLQQETAELPAIVRKYFYHVLTDGAPIIKRAVISQSGGFRAKPEMEQWSNMTAQQTFLASPRAFVWDANISMLPGISISVCDAYIDGKAEMKGKFLSLFTIIDVQGRSELNTGALQRYLAESVWLPTALLPSQGVHWQEIDELHARATISDNAVTVSLDFSFNDKGEVASVYTANRYREVSGEYQLTPWGGKLFNYIEVDGYRIPSEGEVSWYLKDKVYTYWKATLTDVAYE